MPQRGGKVFNRDDWLPMEGEGAKGYSLRLALEGHTVPDAFMICACAQVGQVMLNSPNALFKCGIASGSITVVFFLAIGFW